jgi:DNA-binding IclR family transcriptional regulator
MHTPPIKELTTAALPEMTHLAEAVGHSVHLVVPSNDHIVFIARVESPATFGFTVSLGYRRPVLDSTSGRVLFAFQTPQRQVEWLRSLRRRAPAHVDVAVFNREAQQVRKDGWLARPSVTVEGVTDVCAPIWGDESENCVANLLVPYMGIIGQKCTIDETARRCRAAADRITAKMRPHLHIEV